MTAARGAARALWVLVAYAARTGRWWVPLLVVAWVVALAVAGSAQVVVPTAVYTLF